jgi:hypothetical protein
MPGADKKPERTAEATAEATRDHSASSRRDERRDESHLERQAQTKVEDAQRRMPEAVGQLQERHQELGRELAVDHQATDASPEQRHDERTLLEQFQQAQQDQLADAQQIELAAVQVPGLDRAVDDFKSAVTARMEQDEAAFLDALYAPQGADARRDAMRAVLATQDEERTKLQQAGRELTSAVSPERALQEDYQRLADTIATYDELGRQTGEWNAAARELYDLAKDSREYSGLRLDAEHFIDKRFFEPFEKELAQLGIKSEGEMPAFAVHTEYHLRSPESLSRDAGLPADKALHGTTLTQEKQDAIPHDKARERYPKLQDLLKAFEDFWKKKDSVKVRGQERKLGASYWDRLAPKFKQLQDEAEKKDL